jgi:hypothetical protein
MATAANGEGQCPSAREFDHSRDIFRVGTPCNQQRMPIERAIIRQPQALVAWVAGSDESAFKLLSERLEIQFGCGGTCQSRCGPEGVWGSG